MENKYKYAFLFLFIFFGCVPSVFISSFNKTNIDAQLSTFGGTSDGRFIAKYCPVVEFGLIGKTMHQVDEKIRIDDFYLLFL